MTVSALKIENLSISYGAKRVVHDVALDVRGGEFFGLMGLNGAGKTTIIKAVLGLRGAEAGDIQMMGQDAGNASARQVMAFLPERFDPPWFLSGMEFLAFSARLYGRKLDSGHVLEFADRLALDRAALGRRVQTYSKGMRQKLGILGCVVTGCPLFILDEPMSGLDPMARANVKDMLLELKARNHTIFFSSHILADMEEICDRVALLHEGTIKFVGTPAELKIAAQADNLERAFLRFIAAKNAA